MNDSEIYYPKVEDEVSKDTNCCCSHAKIVYNPIWRDNGMVSDRWECSDCKTVFWPEPMISIKTNKWISVKERLPENTNNVLIYGGYGYIIAYRDIVGNCWEPIWVDQETGTPYVMDCDVTHWQPLPEPPQDTEEK